MHMSEEFMSTNCRKLAGRQVHKVVRKANCPMFQKGLEFRSNYTVKL